MLKKYFLMFLGLLFVVTANAADEPILVIDALNQPKLPNHFRTTSDTLPLGVKINTRGLSNLHAMGSAEFSEGGLLKVIEKIKAPIIVVDLRQESHGYVDGNAISWYATRDWGNLGKTSEQVEADQQKRLDFLAKKAKVTLNKITDQNNEGQVTQVKPTVFELKNVMSEAQLTQQHKVGYIRFYVTDHIMPNDIQVDRFIEFVKGLPSASWFSKATWLYFHCRAGKGRTTTFMSMYDMMRNAKEVSLEDILQRQRALGGIDLGKLPADNTGYKYSLLMQRVNFLNNFYQYCKTNQDNFATTWSAWKKANNIVDKSDLKKPVSKS